MKRVSVMLLAAAILVLALTVRVGADDKPSPAVLNNPGFEAGTDGWEVHVYGAKPQIAADTTVVKEGRQSLRISATEASDTALGQEVQLKPKQLYRCSGWVRTQQLDPRGAPVCGTLQIQQLGGAGVIASGVNHRGDTDWSQVNIVFEAPPNGKARVAVFFVGFGKGTGTAWFDDLRLEQIDPATVPVKVTRTPLFPGMIDPNQYGQFVEYLCDLVPSMWAEKLYDGSFEGLTPYKFYYLKETDFRERPWYPTGATNRAEFALDRAKPVSGLVAKKIAIKDGAPCTVGIAQDGIAIGPEQPCTFACWLRQDGIKGPVTIRVYHGVEEHAVCRFTPTGEWQKYQAKLAFPKDDTQATLSITFRGPGTLWLDNASLMPERHRRRLAGRRRRGGAGAQAGDHSLRRQRPGRQQSRRVRLARHARRPGQAQAVSRWGGLQPTGPGLEEIVQFCRAVGAEPLICVRVSKKDARDAADQVEYFNGAVETPMGRLRAKNGHAEPYRIKYWQVGNERAGKDYEARLPIFCQAIKKVDPSIQLLSSYPTAGVLDRAGEWLDYVCPHHYAIANLTCMENDLVAVRELIRRRAPQKAIKVAVTEWNTTAGDIGPPRAMLWSLDNALACARYHNLLHRYGDLVAIANRSNLCNSFCSGIIQTDNHRLYKTPTYYAQQFYATLAGNRALRLESTLPAGAVPDFSATLSAAGDVVTLFAVNQTLSDVTRPVDLSAFGEAGREAKVWTLTDTRKAGEPDVTNSFADPERVVPVPSKLRADGTRFDYRFPALSLTVMQWRVK